MEQAKAIIMTRLGCTEVQAFGLLRAVSQNAQCPRSATWLPIPSPEQQQPADTETRRAIQQALH